MTFPFGSDPARDLFGTSGAPDSPDIFLTYVVLGLILLLAVAGALWYAWRRMQREGIGNLPQQTRFRGDYSDAIAELDRRLARGDITRQDYERMRRDLLPPAA